MTQSSRLATFVHSTEDNIAAMNQKRFKNCVPVFQKYFRKRQVTYQVVLNYVPNIEPLLGLRNVFQGIRTTLEKKTSNTSGTLDLWTQYINHVSQILYVLFKIFIVIQNVAKNKVGVLYIFSEQ